MPFHPKYFSVYFLRTRTFSVQLSSSTSSYTFILYQWNKIFPLFCVFFLYEALCLPNWMRLFSITKIFASSVGGTIREELYNYKHITLFLWIIGPFMFKCLLVKFSSIVGLLVFTMSIFGKPLPSFIVISEVLLKPQTKQIGQEPIRSLENKGLSHPANGSPLWMSEWP